MWYTVQGVVRQYSKIQALRQFLICLVCADYWCFVDVLQCHTIWLILWFSLFWPRHRIAEAACNELHGVIVFIGDFACNMTAGLPRPDTRKETDRICFVMHPLSSSRRHYTNASVTVTESHYRTLRESHTFQVNWNQLIATEMTGSVQIQLWCLLTSVLDSWTVVMQCGYYLLPASHSFGCLVSDAAVTLSVWHPTCTESLLAEAKDCLSTLCSFAWMVIAA